MALPRFLNLDHFLRDLIGLLEHLSEMVPAIFLLVIGFGILSIYCNCLMFVHNLFLNLVKSVFSSVMVLQVLPQQTFILSVIAFVKQELILVLENSLFFAQSLFIFLDLLFLIRLFAKTLVNLCLVKIIQTFFAKI